MGACSMAKIVQLKMKLLKHSPYSSVSWKTVHAVGGGHHMPILRKLQNPTI